MSTAAQQRRTPLGLFADKPAPRLYDRIVEVLRVRHYSRRTEDAYVHWIRRYIEFHQHRHPRQLAEGDVNRFLTNLATKFIELMLTSRIPIATELTGDARG